MHLNGTNIYKTMSMFDHIPAQATDDKVNEIFNTDNELKNTFFNDLYLNNLEDYVNNKISKRDIITHVINCLKPIIFQGGNFNSKEYNSIIKHTLVFKINHMTSVEKQIEFLFNEETVEHIRDKISMKTNIHNVDKNYIFTVLKNEIDNHPRNKELHSTNNKIIYNIYINPAILFSERDLFIMIDNTIEKVSRRFNSENLQAENNSKLDKWKTMLGHDGNDLRQNINIKLNTKRPSGMRFNMSY